MDKTKIIEEKPFVVYNHKVAKYLAQHGYFWTEFRRDNFDKTKAVFIYCDNVEEIKNLIDIYKSKN